MDLQDWLTKLNPGGFDDALKLLGVTGALLSAIGSIAAWLYKSWRERQLSRTEAERLAESRRIEATRPFLERQLALYSETVKVVAVLANTGDPSLENRFWELYYGELALVENQEVAAAMKDIRDALRANAASKSISAIEKEDTKEAMGQLALNLAHACRNSLDRSWAIHAWTSPDEASRTLNTGAQTPRLTQKNRSPISGLPIAGTTIPPSIGNDANQGDGGGTPKDHRSGKVAAR